MTSISRESTKPREAYSEQLDYRLIRIKTKSLELILFGYCHWDIQGYFLEWI